MGCDFLIEEINEDKHFVGKSMASEIFGYARDSDEQIEERIWAGDVPFLTYLITEASRIEEMA